MEYVKGVALVKALSVKDTMLLVTETAKCIYSLITNIVVQSEAPNIMTLIKEADLERKTRLLECVLFDIDQKMHYTNSLLLCITDLRQCLNEIKDMLVVVKTRSSYNKSIWILKRARKYVYEDVYTSLKIAIINLEDRRKSLVVVLNINHGLIVGAAPAFTDIICEGHILLEMPNL